MSSRGMALTRQPMASCPATFFPARPEPLPRSVEDRARTRGLRAAAVANSAVASTTADAIRRSCTGAMLPSCKKERKVYRYRRSSLTWVKFGSRGSSNEIGAAEMPLSSARLSRQHSPCTPGSGSSPDCRSSLWPKIPKMPRHRFELLAEQTCERLAVRRTGSPRSRRRTPRPYANQRRARQGRRPAARRAARLLEPCR